MSAENKCASCPRDTVNDTWEKDKGVLKCAFCNRPQHIVCTIGFSSLPRDFVNKINHTTSSLIFKCANCVKIFNKAQVQSALKDANQFREDFMAEVSKKLNLTEIKLADALKNGRETQEKHAQIMREHDLLKKRHIDECAQLNTSIQSKNVAIRKMTTQLDEANSMLQNAQRDLKTAQGETHELNRLNEALQEKFQILETNMDVDANLDQITQLNAVLKQKIEDLSNMNSRHEENIAALNNKLLELSNSEVNGNAHNANNVPNSIAELTKLMNDQFAMIYAKMTEFSNKINNAHSYAHAASNNVVPVTNQIPAVASRTNANSLTPRNAAILRPATELIDPKENIVTESYAQAIAHSKIPIACIRNITLVGNARTTEKTYNTIMNDKENLKFNFISISRHSPDNITVKCNNEESAADLEAHLNVTYKDLVVVKIPEGKLPAIKIINIRTKFATNQELKDTIIAQNSWIANANFEISDCYEVSTNARSYHNAIITCDLDSHALILGKGFVFIGMQQCRVYEFVNLIQCIYCNHSFP